MQSIPVNENALDSLVNIASSTYTPPKKEPFKVNQKLLIIDPSSIAFTAKSIGTTPLGGTQSSVCYLSNRLSKHFEVAVMNSTKEITINKWLSVPLDRKTESIKQFVDQFQPAMIIVVSTGDVAKMLKPHISPHIPMVMWMHHDIVQPCVQILKDDMNLRAWDGWIFVSEWQRDRYVEQFKIPKGKTFIVPNGIPDIPIPVATKKNIMTFTTVPYRGLEFLLDVWPIVKKHVPDAEFRVFSSMKVYQTSDDEYLDLYDRAKKLGVDYRGSVSQPELMSSLAESKVWCLPTKLAETFCITAHEANATGCHIIATDIGAFKDVLPGTFTNDLDPQKWATKIIQMFGLDPPEKKYFTYDHSEKAFLSFIKSYRWRAQIPEPTEKDIDSITTSGLFSPYFIASVLYRYAGKLNDQEKQIQILKYACVVSPSQTVLWNGLADLYRKSGHPDMALGCLNRSLELDPNQDLIYNTITFIYQSKGENFEDIAKHYLQLFSNTKKEGYLNYAGQAFIQANKLSQALNLYVKAYEINKENKYAIGNLATGCYNWMDNTPLMYTLFEKCLSLESNQLGMWYNLGIITEMDGRPDYAKKFYQRCLDINPNHFGSIFRMGCCMSVIVTDDTILKKERDYAVKTIKSLMDKKYQTANDPSKEIVLLPMFYHYHGTYSRDFNELVAKLFRFQYPVLNTKFDLKPVKGRVGILSGYLRDHVETRLMWGVMEHLKYFFDVRVYIPQQSEDTVSEYIRENYTCVNLSIDLLTSAEIIANDGLDVLIHTGLGVHSTSYFLAFFRLARVQMAHAWGHPVTSGIDTIDHYVSMPWDNPSVYTENLIRLGGVSPYYRKPEFDCPSGILPIAKSASVKVDLPPGRIYLCPQNLVKFQPQFARTLAKLSHADKSAKIGLVWSKKKPFLKDSVANQLKHFGIRDDAVVWIDHQSHPNLLELMRKSAVMLDPFPWCGGVTSLEGLSQNTPIVTKKCDYLNGRLTEMMYRQLGFTDLVAKDEEDYVRLAIHAAENRYEYSEKIRNNSEKLFSRKETLDEWVKVIKKV